MPKTRMFCRACLLMKNKYCNGTKCLPFQDETRKKQILSNPIHQGYSGLRFTSDAMDCSLPIAIDSHSGCSYSCLYCFANNLTRAVDRVYIQKLPAFLDRKSIYSEWPIGQLEKFLNQELKSETPKAMYPLLDQGMPIQLGALGDPLDDIEPATGWLLKAIPLFIKHKIPVRVGTKGAKTMLLKKYRDAFHQSPEQFWFAFSIITANNRKIEAVDWAAPNATTRLKAMREYAKAGHPVSLRLRPYLPGISDDWKTLMYKAAEAGAKAISFEFVFLEAALTDRQKVMYDMMFKAMGNPKFQDEWMEASNPKESCRRASRALKFDITMQIRDYAHELGFTFGISDPHFKEFNDTGSCCGFRDDDPWFGKYSRRQMTDVIVKMRKAWQKGKRRLMTYQDWGPEWAENIGSSVLIAMPTTAARTREKQTFGMHMRNKWNDPSHPRGPWIYFAKQIQPIGVDKITGDVVYEYSPVGDWTWESDRKFKGKVIKR